MNCDKCGTKLISSGLTVTIEGKQKTFCADCYEELKDEYAKEKSCKDCKNFDRGSCTITGEKLIPLYMGYDQFFLQAEKCEFYMLSLWKKPDSLENPENEDGKEDFSEEGLLADDSQEDVSKRD